MALEPIDSRTHRVLSGVSRVAVLEALRAGPDPLDVESLAGRVGLHPNTVRSHLDQLVEAGLVTSSIQPRTTPGRPRLQFRAVAAADAGPADSYKVLAEILASGIRGAGSEPGEVAVAAGRQWGHQVAPDHGGTPDAAAALGHIVTLLDDIGFAPTVSATPDPTAPTVIELHRCPFMDVAREHTDVVCAVHLGLIQGALDQMHAPPTAVRLEPFVRRDLCLVHVSPVPVGSTADAIGAGA
ncbi:helix-turn-helix transcriptional regulator [Pengzhenrongella sicca]|uniref:Helix-turn-helix domain-containing protein n=1 Tax=Pengzhenrongella sicca TaxID=2819238 RepID=A0A8A4ZGF4_9MICO|nr:helix-turn-helix domain-containing protein [Pengzhenrongella sicca]QTE30974.1 helix-turn-helix domain-containing protein [Pengzhenrongella sicca]